MRMSDRQRSYCFALSLIGSGLTPLAASADATDALAEGGRLYDKWWAEYSLSAPKKTHPAYPSAGKKTGKDTWRCKECHGWDYSGIDGAYSSGSHFTGIAGVRALDGAPEGDVTRVLKDPVHQYDQVMLEPALEKLARFIAGGQMDMSRWIDRRSKRVLGDSSKGRVLFEDKCARCHGDDGRRLNFKNDDSPEFVGTVARKNPWELLHKIRNGQPGSRMPMGPGMMGKWKPNEAMPHFRKLSDDEQAAIAAYAQTLPDK